MMSGLVKFALSIVFIFLVIFPAVFVSSQEAGGEGEERKSPADFDYEIYELIDRLNQLKPQHSTLYDLLNVKPSASSEEISRQFRRLGFAYHPDKTQGDLEAKKMFNLYSGASQVLKVPESRKRYEWILNEAPPWHRSQVYLIRKLKTGGEFRKSGRKEVSVAGFLAFVFCFMIMVQLIMQWVRFLLNRYWIWSGQRALKSIPAQELRRMEKKAQRSDLTFLANVDANYENLQAARSVPLSIPKPTDLFIFQIPLSLVHSLIPKKKEKST